MTKNKMFDARANRGFSLLEMLIAVFITGIVAASAFHFYVSMNQQVITQQEISDMQQTARATLQEIGQTVRQAGYMVPASPAYDVVDDRLAVYYSFTDELNDVDSVIYFLQEFDEDEYADVIDRPDGMTLYRLMKQVSDGSAATFASNVTSIQYTPIGSSEMAITIEVTATKADHTYSENNGFRTFSNTERVTMRNVGI